MQSLKLITAVISVNAPTGFERPFHKMSLITKVICMMQKMQTLKTLSSRMEKYKDEGYRSANSQQRSESPNNDWCSNRSIYKKARV